MEEGAPGLQLDVLAASFALYSDEQACFGRVSLFARPAKVVLELSPNQRQAWQALRQSQSINPTPRCGLQRVARLPRTNPSEESRLAASNYARLDRPKGDQEDYSGFHRIRPSIRDLACLQALDRSSNTPCHLVCLTDWGWKLSLILHS